MYNSNCFVYSPQRTLLLIKRHVNRNNYRVCIPGVPLVPRPDGITAAERRVGVGYCARGYVLWGVTTGGMCARYLGAVRSSRSYLNRQLPAVFRIVRKHARTHARGHAIRYQTQIGSTVVELPSRHVRERETEKRERERDAIPICDHFLPVSRSQFVD